MWTVLGIFFGSSILTLYSMKRELLPTLSRNSSISRIQTFLVLNKNQFQSLFDQLLKMFENKEIDFLAVEKLMINSEGNEEYIVAFPTPVYPKISRNFALSEIGELLGEQIPEDFTIESQKTALSIIEQTILHAIHKNKVHFNRRYLSIKPAAMPKPPDQIQLWQSFRNRQLDRPQKSLPRKNLKNHLTEN